MWMCGKKRDKSVQNSGWKEWGDRERGTEKDRGRQIERERER